MPRFGVDVQVRGDRRADVEGLDKLARIEGGRSTGAQSGGGCGCTGAEYSWEFRTEAAARAFVREVQTHADVCFATLSIGDRILRVKDVRGTCHNNIARDRSFTGAPREPAARRSAGTSSLRSVAPPPLYHGRAGGGSCALNHGARVRCEVCGDCSLGARARRPPLVAVLHDGVVMESNPPLYPVALVWADGARRRAILPETKFDEYMHRGLVRRVAHPGCGGARGGGSRGGGAGTVGPIRRLPGLARSDRDPVHAGGSASLTRRPHTTTSVIAPAWRRRPVRGMDQFASPGDHGTARDPRAEVSKWSRPDRSLGPDSTRRMYARRNLAL